MQVHQPFELFIGIAMLLLGMVEFGRDLHRALTYRFANVYSNWRMVGLNIMFATIGLSRCSKAFDLPHHVLHRTSTLVNFELLSLVIVGTIGAVMLITENRRKNAEQLKAAVEPPRV